MMMANWRDPAAFVLLAHLITLSKGINVEGLGAFEQILAKNVSIILIDDKADSLLDTAIKNVTSLNSTYSNNNNDSMVLDTALIKDEKLLEAELEEAIESAAASGQVILISPPADRTNLTNQNPVIVIEAPAVTPLAVSNNKTSSQIIIKESSPNFDQEIAQTQTRPRIDYDNHADSDNAENLENLLAIAEYEPQKIDAKRTDKKTPQLPGGKANSGQQTSSQPLAEQTHYDVPKRRAPSRSSPRTSDSYRPTTPKPDLKVSSTGQWPLTAAPALGLDPVKIEEKNNAAERRQFSSNSAFYHKPTEVKTESLRDRRHPKIDSSLPAKSSLPRKSTYDSIPRRTTNSPTSPSSTTSTAVASTLGPSGLSANIETPLRHNQNLSDVVNPVKMSARSSRVRATRLPLADRSILGNETSFGKDKSADSILPTSEVPQANRRIDYYLTPQYAESVKDKRKPLTNQQLGFLTRYNLPSLVTTKHTNSKLYPGAPPLEAKREGQYNYNPTNSRSAIPTHGSYVVHDRTNSGRPPIVDYSNSEDRRAPNPKATPVNDSYEDYEENAPPNKNRVENVPYQRNGNQRLTATTPAYDSFIKSAKASHSPIASSTPHYDFYEDSSKESEENSKIVKNSPEESEEDYKESAENSKIVRNSPEASDEDYKEYSAENSKLVRNSPEGSDEDYKDSAETSKKLRNAPVASYEDYEESENSNIVRNSRQQPVASTTPVYDSYEDYKESGSAKLEKNSPAISSTPVHDSYEDDEESDSRKSLPQRQKLIINDDAELRKRLPINPYQVSSQPTYDYLGRRTIQPVVTPANLLNNPIYQLHGLKSTAAPATSVYNPYTNYPTRNPPRLPSPEKQHGQVPRATVNNQRIASTTPAYKSFERLAQAYNPSAAIPRINNPNYVDHRLAQPTYNVNDKQIVSTSTTPGNSNAGYRYRGRVRNPHAAIPGNIIDPLPQRNLHRASKASITGHVESNESNNDYDESNDRRTYNPDSRKQHDPKVEQYRERNNQATSSGGVAGYASHESGEGEIVVSPSDGAEVIESNSADYGNRIRTRVDEEHQDRVVAPSFTRAGSTTPRRRASVKASALNYDDRRPVRIHVDEVPVESVNRADIRDRADYEDEVPASSGHEEKHETHEEAKDGGGEHKHEEGGGGKHEEDHHEDHGEKEEKGYKAWHEHDKGDKGHHDKEGHDKEYEEKKGEKKKHEEESDYHKEHHHAEEGEKEASFGEKGEHEKGHSTKGQHVVHKKDEYEKKTEFYDESHEEDGDEKEGAYHHEHESEKGGHEKIGHHDSAHHEEKYGKKGEHEKGHQYHEKKGHEDSDGHDEHHHHEEKYGKKGGHEEGKKWSHKKGDNGKKGS